MESTKETGCQAPENPILCINNCGFFGSAATMNMCSKCHKDMISKQENAKLAASSFDTIVNGTTPPSSKPTPPLELKTTPTLPQPHDSSSSSQVPEPNVKAGPTRCTTCRKRVGLTGFSCRCGNLFCSAHRYSDKHECPFDYQTAARDAIAKANPVVKADKIDKI